MEIEFLGTGTSTGVPQIKCECEVCKSENPKDRRLRASAIVRTNNKSILIDCGPDFREQMLRASSKDLDFALITHSHYDHVGGMDDLRPYCHPNPFLVFCQPNVNMNLHERIPYCFRNHLYPGVPTFDVKEINDQPFIQDGIKIEPLKILHYKLSILGYKIGNLAYVTDAKIVPEETINKLIGIDTLVINALRPKPHISHMSLSECLSVIERIKPRVAYLTHICDNMGLHDEVEPTLPKGVHLAYDGLIVHVK